VHVPVGARVLGVRNLVWDGVEAGGVNHAAGDATTEFLDLFADVEEECIRAPATQKHDGIGWYAIKIHGHSCSGPIGVGTKEFSWETEVFLAHGTCVGTEEGEESSGSKPGRVAVGGIHEGVHRGGWMDSW